MTESTSTILTQRGGLLAVAVTSTAAVVLREATAVAWPLGLDVVALHVDAPRQVLARQPHERDEGVHS